MKIHELKCWTPYYQDLLDGTKTFEIRKNDRGFLAGDYLFLREWDHYNNRYTVRCCYYVVTYIMEGVFGLPEDVCIMSIKKLERY